MQNEILLLTEGKKEKYINIKISQRFLVGLGGTVLILAVLFGVSHFSSASSESIQTASSTGFLDLLNPLKKVEQAVKNVITPKSTNNQPATTVRVVSEESQVIDVVKKDSPAVVSIIATADVPKMENCLRTDPNFESFGFNIQIPSLCQNGTEKQRIGAGSGFIVSPDGYIVTNKHVVEDLKADYTVVLNDVKNKGKKLKATVLARDPNNDIAVLRIDMSNLPYINFGDSDKLQVGQTAIAIGYSLGEFDNTVSKGVVSGLSRSITASGTKGGSEQLRGLIQTDAAINPGNSGGPLLDIDGNAIGMNVAMANAQSVGFAIPINSILSAFDQVKKTGSITKSNQPYIGVRFTPITEEIKQSNSLPYDYGMLVSRGEKVTDLAVIPGSPADKAGIAENDIILEADGQQLNESYTLADAIIKHKVGETISFKIYHKGAEKTLSIKLENKP